MFEYICTASTNLLAKYTSGFHWGPRIASIISVAGKADSGWRCLEILNGRVLPFGRSKDDKGHPLVADVVADGGFNLPLRAQAKPF